MKLTYRILIYGEASAPLSAAIAELNSEFVWETCSPADVPFQSADDVDAVVVCGPPFPGQRSELLPASSTSPVLGVIDTPTSDAFLRVRDLALDDILVVPFTSEELRFRLLTRIARSKANVLRATLDAAAPSPEQIEAALDRTDEHLKLLIQSAVDFAIFTTDLDRRITFWSSGAEILFGWLASEAIGQHVDMIFTKEDREAGIPVKEAETARVAGRSENERWHLRKSGERFWASGFLMPLRDDGIRGYLKIVRDRTERKRLEQQLEEAVADRTAELRAVNEQLDSYASYVAHDLRSPVRVIRGLCEMMQDRLRHRTDPEEVDLINRVIRSVDKMNDLITRLLTYSRTITSPAPLQPVPLDAIVEDAIAKHATLAQMHSAVFQVEQPLPAAMGASFLLSQVVDNLVGNALKFHQKDRNPHIRISAERLGKRVRLKVEDNGIGIDPEFHSRIFQPLQRLHTQDSFEGNGLGLSIVAKAVERMNGRFGVESKLNEGSVFWVELQAAPRAKS